MAAVVLLPGCGIDRIWNEVPARQPSITPASATPEPDERTQTPYTGALAPDAKCVTASKDMLAELQDIGGVGGAITYVKGARVKSNGRWWTVAVATEVQPNSSYNQADVDAVDYFVTNAPSITDADWPDEVFYWQLSATQDPAAKKALECLQKVPDPPKKVDYASPDSYTGKLAKGATCSSVSAKMLSRLEEVGQVGGAITYSRGQMVRANAKWWTVAVATQVNPNSAGYTRANVPSVAYFVTNDPSYKASSKTKIVYFPIKAGKDKAAAKARSCLGG